MRFPLRTRTIVAGKLMLIIGSCLVSLSCESVSRNVQAEPSPCPPQTSTYGPPRIVGTIKNPALKESSGLVASHTMPGVYWTHNDSGDGPFIYAIRGSGDSIGVWRVTGAENVDWEDISIGPGAIKNQTYLYIGDIGDNDSSRSHIVIYRVSEPSAAPNSRKTAATKPQPTATAEALRFRYPDGKHDAETLLVHPVSGVIYIITKIALEKPAVYEAVPPFSSSKPTTLKKIAELKLPSLFGGILTGGSVSPNGRRIALCDYFQGYELTLPEGAGSFDEIWKQTVVGFNFGKRQQGESIAYRLDGSALIGTSEGRGTELIEVIRK